MSEQDDIFDLEDFVKKHGDKYIKAAWKNHLDYFIQCENDATELNNILSVLSKLKAIFKEIS